MASYTYLQGDVESPDETLRHFIARNWTAENTENVTPVFLSPQGQGTEPADDERRIAGQNFRALQKKNAVIFKRTDTVANGADSWNNDRSSINYIVTIDVFAESSSKAMKFTEEITNILFDSLINNTNRIVKSNNTEDSFITRFDRSSIDWLRVGEIEDVGVTEQYSGEIGCLVEKSRT